MLPFTQYFNIRALHKENPLHFSARHYFSPRVRPSTCFFLCAMQSDSKTFTTPGTELPLLCTNRRPCSFSSLLTQQMSKTLLRSMQLCQVSPSWKKDSQIKIHPGSRTWEPPSSSGAFCYRRDRSNSLHSPIPSPCKFVFKCHLQRFKAGKNLFHPQNVNTSQD